MPSLMQRAAAQRRWLAAADRAYGPRRSTVVRFPAARRSARTRTTTTSTRPRARSTRRTSRVRRSTGAKRRPRTTRSRRTTRRRVSSRRIGKRRGHIQKVRATKLTLHQRTNFIPPTSAQILNATQFTSGVAFIPTDLSQSGIPPISGTGNVLTNAFFETPNSFVLGSYVFDFTRMVSLANQSAQGNFPQLFERVRVGRGRMTMKRIDNGANEMLAIDYTGVAASGACRAVYPIPPQGKAIPLLIHYFRLRPDESTTSDWTENNNLAFMTDSRRKTRTLWPGRKITFSFVPLFHGEKYAEVIARQGTASSGDQVVNRRLTLPTKWRKQMSFPSAVFLQLDPTFTYSTDAEQGGIGPSYYRVMSSTLLFMFEVRQFNAITTGQLTVPTNASGSTTVTAAMLTRPAQVPYLWRSESCSVTYSRLRLAAPYSVALAPTVYPIGSMPVGAAGGPPQVFELYMPMRLGLANVPERVASIPNAVSEPGYTLVTTAGPVVEADVVVPPITNP